MPSFHVSHRSCLASVVLRESSFNMTGGDEDIEGVGAPKICILQNQQERGGS